VVREVKKGSGPALKSNDKITFRYVGVEYRSGKTFEVRWDEPFIIQEFGNGELLEGEETGMRGMRVGGRRELIVPERLGYKNGVGPLIYMIELVSVEK
jgi:FKBP-type peptidyl-prolyl cis-trans isomerase